MSSSSTVYNPVGQISSELVVGAVEPSHMNVPKLDQIHFSSKQKGSRVRSFTSSRNVLEDDIMMPTRGAIVIVNRSKIICVKAAFFPAEVAPVQDSLRHSFIWPWR